MKKKIKGRNPLVTKARLKTNAGPLKNKKLKRKNGKNKQAAFLEDNY